MKDNLLGNKVVDHIGILLKTFNSLKFWSVWKPSNAI